MTDGPSSTVIQSLAPSGRLRAAVNSGNRALFQSDAATGTLGGISLAIGRELAARLGVALKPVLYPSAGQAFDAKDLREWDVAFLAVDPERAEKLTFSSPYVVIEGTFVVKEDSEFRFVRDVDRLGCRICSTENAAYDLHMRRIVTQAKIIRHPNPGETLKAFRENGCDAAAGVRQSLDGFAQQFHVDYRVLPDHFAQIDQAIAVRRGLDEAARYIEELTRELITSGFVRSALDASGQTTLVVPQPGGANRVV